MLSWPRTQFRTQLHALEHQPVIVERVRTRLTDLITALTNEIATVDQEIHLALAQDAAWATAATYLASTKPALHPSSLRSHLSTPVTISEPTMEEGAMDEHDDLDQLAETGLLLKHIGFRPPHPVGKLTYIAGGEVDEVSVTLRFFGRDLDPDNLTRMLGCPPTTARRKGDIVRHHWIATTGVWFLHQPRTTESLAVHIKTLFDRLPHEFAIWDALQPFNGQLFCGGWCRTWNRAIDVPSPLLHQIAARNLSVTLDMYFEPDESDEEDESESARGY